MFTAIYILWYRQIIKYFRSSVRLIGSLGQPILFMIAFGFGLNRMYQGSGGQGTYLQFIAPGIMAMSVIFMAFFSGVEVIWDRKFGFLRETLVAPVPRFAIVLGKVLGGSTIAVFQRIVGFLVSLAFGFRPENWLMVPFGFLYLFLIAFFCSALGILIACNMDDGEAFPVIMNFVVMPLYFLSGAFFSVKDSPDFLKKIISFNPIAYGVDGARGAMMNNGYFGFSTDFAVLVICGLVLLAIGNYFFAKIEA